MSTLLLIILKTYGTIGLIALVLCVFIRLQQRPLEKAQQDHIGELKEEEAESDKDDIFREWVEISRGTK